MNVPLEIEGSGRYTTTDDEKKETHKFMLSFHMTSHTEEIPKEKYIAKQDEVKNNNILNAALMDSEATHIVSYIEYGSDLYIEMTYEGKYFFNFYKTSIIYHEISARNEINLFVFKEKALIIMLKSERVLN